MKLWWRMNIKGQGGGKMAGNIFIRAQLIHNLDALLPGDQELTGFQSQMWLISALNQSGLEFSGLMYIFFSLQNLALFSTNSMTCLRNCKSNEGRDFLTHVWDALANLWGTSRSTCPGCSWQRWGLLGFPFPEPQTKTTFKEAVPIACLILASNGWCLGGKRNHPSLSIVTSLPYLHFTSGPLTPCLCFWYTFSSLRFSLFITYPPLMLPTFKTIIA